MTSGSIKSVKPSISAPSAVVGGVAVVGAILVLGGVYLPATMLLACALLSVALRNPALGVAAIVASVPLQSAVTVGVGSTDLTATKIAIWVTFLAYLCRVLLGASRVRLDPIAIALGLYLLVLMLSIVNATDTHTWAGEVYRWTAMLAVYLVAINSIATLNDVTWIVFALAGGVLAMSALAFWQVATGAGPATFAIEGRTRAFGTFGEPNPFAAFLELTVLLLTGLVFARAGARIRTDIPLISGRVAVVILSVAMIAGIIALGLTQSRGGLLGFLAGGALVVLLTGGRIRRIGAVGAGIFVLAVLILPAGIARRDRFSLDALGTGSGQTRTGNFAAQERSSHWRAAIRMVESSPVLGVGAGNFNANYRTFTSNWRFRIPRGHAHNAYLQALAQAGIVGLVAYLGLLGVAGRQIVKALTISDLGMRGLMVGIVGASCAIAVHGFFDYLHVLNLGVLLAVLWSIASVGSQKTGALDQSHAT